MCFSRFDQSSHHSEHKMMLTTILCVLEVLISWDELNFKLNRLRGTLSVNWLKCFDSLGHCTGKKICFCLLNIKKRSTSWSNVTCEEPLITKTVNISKNYQHKNNKM